MNSVKKIIAFAIDSLIILSIAGINVIAASTTQDGLAVSFTVLPEFKTIVFVNECF